MNENDLTFFSEIYPLAGNPSGLHKPVHTIRVLVHTISDPGSPPRNIPAPFGFLHYVRSRGKCQLFSCFSTYTQRKSSMERAGFSPPTETAAFREIPARLLTILSAARILIISWLIIGQPMYFAFPAWSLFRKQSAAVPQSCIQISPASRPPFLQTPPGGPFGFLIFRFSGFQAFSLSDFRPSSFSALLSVSRIYLCTSVQAQARRHEGMKNVKI